MDDFQGLLAKDFGLKRQGKSAPMAPPRNSPTGGFNTFSSSLSYGLGSSATDFTRSSSSSRKKSDSVPIFDDHDRPSDDLLFKDVFGGHGSSESRARSPPSAPAFDYDAMFKDQSTSKSASMPIFDKPVYDDDIFEGIPGLKSSSGSASARYENVFASDPSSPPKHKKQNSSPFDDLLGDFGTQSTEPKKAERVREEKDTSAFDDLIPGFGRSSSPPTNRSTSERSQSQEASPGTRKQGSGVLDDDPFSVFKSASTPAVSSSKGFTDPLEEISKFSSSGNRKTGRSSAEERIFDDLDPLDSLAKTGNMNGMQLPNESSESHSPEEVLVDDFPDSHRIPSVSIPQSSSPTYVNRSANDKTSRSDKSYGSSDDVWLTVSEIPLFTQPTSTPPPSRPPPPRPTRPLKKKVNEPSYANSAKYPRSPRSARASGRNSVGSQIDELEEFAMRRTPESGNGYSEVYSAVDSDANSVAAESAAAMKDAMDKAEAKFRHAREMRGKESKATKIKEGVQTENKDFQERERQERLERERLEKERELEKAREIEERQEREREHRRIERERIEKERELARQAVERATREARERAAAGAHAKAQRVAVEKASAEARERTERAAVQRAQAEARSRAAVEARERAEKAAAERANAEAREREVREREARARVERAAAERAAAEARQRAAAQARANQQRSENDFESFGMGSRPSSAPRHRAQDPLFDTQNKGGSFDVARTSPGTASNIRKASSTTNIVDDLSSIFGVAASQSMEFQDVEGESEERRRARMERNQRTKERAAKALAEKNERDLQAQREQAEKHRVGETLDVEIKRWAAGKEGNLRALLSTLQYVLWPECGWQPISLTDLITAASVKKVYRKATLCIHPDKVQQKGANIQQKYVAEKVFDLLKEAWNKFNSEELF